MIAGAAAFVLRLSIHDLTRRSTIFFRHIAISWRPFNSRPHTEVDLTDGTEVIKPATFNSRPHTEVDHNRHRKAGISNSFQFTTSHGGRHVISMANYVIQSLSIHDLTRRSTANTHKYREYLYKFFSILYTHPFLHTFVLQFRITFPLCYSYIQCESLGIFCPLYIRTKELTAQSHQNWALFQYAPLCFYTYLPDYKIADCPIPCL